MSRVERKNISTDCVLISIFFTVVKVSFSLTKLSVYISLPSSM